MTIGADRGEIAEVGSPVVIPADGQWDRRRPLRWTTTIIVTATAFLAVLNAGSALEWLDETTPGAATELVRSPIERWNGIVAGLRIDRVRRALHDRWNDARALRFGNERAGEPGTDQR